ncbi:hypothetical protein EG329_002826 [Mollisiaceae sp. DMI_Dod_QoI]|nr:hypothetical protein EG329_002826 [Helotiales sp. DMI_Dod_QoI]
MHETNLKADIRENHHQLYFDGRHVNPKQVETLGKVEFGNGLNLPFVRCADENFDDGLQTDWIFNKSLPVPEKQSHEPYLAALLPGELDIENNKGREFDNRFAIFKGGARGEEAYETEAANNVTGSAPKIGNHHEKPSNSEELMEGNNLENITELRGKDANSPLMARKDSNKRRNNVDSTNRLSEQWSLLRGVPFPECTSRYEQEAFDDYLEATRPGHKALAVIREAVMGPSLTEAGLKSIQEAKVKAWEELFNDEATKVLDIPDQELSWLTENIYGPSATPAIFPPKTRKAHTSLPLASSKTTNEHNPAPLTTTPLPPKARKAPAPLALASPKTTDEYNQTPLTPTLLPPKARNVPAPLPLASPKTMNEYNQAPLTPHKSLPKRPVVEIPSSRQTPRSRDSSPPAKRVAGPGRSRPVSGPRDRERVVIDLTEDHEPYLAPPQRGTGGHQARNRGRRGQGQSSFVTSGRGMFAMGAQPALPGSMQNRGGSFMQQQSGMRDGHSGFFSDQMNNSTTRTSTGGFIPTQPGRNGNDPPARAPGAAFPNQPQLPATGQSRVVVTIHITNEAYRGRVLQILRDLFEGESHPGCTVVENGDCLDVRGPPGRNMRGFIKDRFPSQSISTRME